MHPSWVFHRGKNFNFLPSAYVFSEVLNPLDYDSTHPKNPKVSWLVSTPSQYWQAYSRIEDCMKERITMNLRDATPMGGAPH
jgi:hypothetical protein